MTSGLPATAIALIRGAFGERGASWIDSLPSLVSQLADRWDLELGEPFQNLTFSYVAPALRDGAPVVLKLTVPRVELDHEARALEVFGGHGAVKLLDSDLPAGALLVERAMPGRPLADSSDDEVMVIAAAILDKLWRRAPEDHPFPTILHWTAGFGRMRKANSGGSGPVPAELVDLAERQFRRLLSETRESWLLHGDLHSWNVLRAEREPWLAIDPKGVVGLRELDLAPLVRNRLTDTDDPEQRLHRRVDLLSEHTGLDRERITSGAFAHTVLSTWWSVEDHAGDLEEQLSAAKVMAAALTSAPSWIRK